MVSAVPENLWYPGYCCTRVASNRRRILLIRCIVLNFSWDGCNTQEKWKTNELCKIFGGQIRCIIGNVQKSEMSHVSTPLPVGALSPAPPDYRSIGHVEFPKFETGTFAERKAQLVSETFPSYNVENTAGNARRCHPDRQNSSCFHPGNQAEAFIWKNFQPV